MIRRTLMHRNQELADFEVDLATGRAHVIDASEASVGPFISIGQIQQNRDSILTRFVKSRSIPHSRSDTQSILDSYGASSPAHLAFLGHGLSLSDQYWYRAPGRTENWEDINFFENEWDTGYGEAILSGNYARLATCSPDVPDVTTAGRVIKAWERNDKGIFLVKLSERPDGADLVGAKLASDLCAALFDEGCYIPLEIVKRYGQYCSISPLMLTEDEEFADGKRLLLMTDMWEDLSNKEDGRLTSESCQAYLRAYEALGVLDASAHVARMASLSCLSLLSNFHPANFGVIRKNGLNEWRAAPLFDYGGSFGFIHGENEMFERISNLSAARLLCASYYSFLDSSWDWSWYDSRTLEGFEDHIMQAYAPYHDMPSNFIEFVTGLFVMQRAYVDRIASGE